MTGIEAFLHVLAGAGVTHIFGNPGTTELPLLDALAADARFRYILGLQEVPVVAMADGYALASGGLGVVNVHVSCGLGNSMGMLYNAFIEGSPLLLTAGQVDRRLRLEEPVLTGDLVSVTRPWTKWSHEVQRVEDMPAAVRRAVQTALTPPTGPVFLSLPLDLQSEQSDRLDVSPPTLPDRRVRPPVEALRRAVALLRAARSPAILAGSRVTEAGGIEELVAVSERLGAPVLSESGTSHGRIPFPVDHGLCAGSLPLWSPDVRQRLALRCTAGGRHERAPPVPLPRTDAHHPRAHPARAARSGRLATGQDLRRRGRPARRSQGWSGGAGPAAGRSPDRRRARRPGSAARSTLPAAPRRSATCSPRPRPSVTIGR